MRNVGIDVGLPNEAETGDGDSQRRLQIVAIPRNLRLPNRSRCGIFPARCARRLAVFTYGNPS